MIDVLQATAKGMQYLHSQRIVHRDVAARNILLTGDETVAKVGDFGLARKVDDKYHKSQLTGDPLRWAAPETFPKQLKVPRFKGEVKFASDRWSFGIVTWEVFTFCKDEPYPKIAHPKDLKAKLAAELPVADELEVPHFPQIEKLIHKLLQYDDELRPIWDEIIQELEELRKQVPENWEDDEEMESKEISDAGYGDEPEKTEYDQQESEETK